MLMESERRETNVVGELLKVYQWKHQVREENNSLKYDNRCSYSISINFLKRCCSHDFPRRLLRKLPGPNLPLEASHGLSAFERHGGEIWEH
jgi:hypothetical protein